jgi:TonB family protein
MNNPTIFDELDDAIDCMMAGTGDAANADVRTGIAELLEIVPDLRLLPRADFKARLLLELEWQAAGRTISVSRAPEASQAANRHTDLDLLPTLSGKVGSLYPVRGANVAASVALHAALLLFAGLGLVMVKSTARVADQRIAGATMVDTYIPRTGVRPNHGGGGGGSADMMGASRGEAPRFTQQQFAPPAVVLNDHHPQLPVEPTLIGPPQLNLPRTQTGDPLSNLVALSNGSGVSGIGPGRGDGVGSGEGPGRGPGHGGGTGGDFYLPGNGVTAPRTIYSPEPEFSDEARAAKYQGIVTLAMIVLPDGRASHVRVTRSLGMGLDEKAIEAVRNWRFEPGRKDGRPVPVQVEVEVDFHLY